MKRRLRLRGINGDIEGKVWESDTLLRAGRLATLELVLDDSSVSRRHAEVRPTPDGWRVRDLGSTNGTYVNGARLGPGETAVAPHDIVRFGNVTMVVDLIREVAEEEAPPAPMDSMVVEATENRSWEAAIDGFALERDTGDRCDHQLMVLLKAGHHLVHLEKEDDLLNSILNDAVGALSAQRGAIVLSDPATGQLKLRALATKNDDKSRVEKPIVGARTSFSQNLAQRCFTRGESILCTSVDEDPELAGSRSIAEGTMASVLCVLLRTPRKRLGVLHLDRGPMDPPFTKDDLKLTDALAAHVSAGIESAQLIRKERDLFFATVSMLAQAVEMRDQYTYGHTQRVTEYSYLLGQELGLSADDMHLIRIGTPLHDIGKIGIDDKILKKPDRLTPAEFEIMKTHTTKGAKILEQVADLASVIPIVLSHHERWDGQGYPDRLAGDNIPRLARIVCVADAFDAMTSDRPYRQGMPADAGFAEVEKQKGKQFDPLIADAFLRIRPHILQEMQSQTKRIGIQLATLRVAT